MRDAAFAVSAEAAHGESRTAIVQRIGPAGQVSQADVADPVAAVEADGRVEVIRVVVPDADFVDHVLRDDPRVTDGEIPALLGEVGVGEGAGVQLGSLVIHEPLEQVVLRGQHLIRAPGGRIGIVGKVTNREIVVGQGIVRRRDGRRQHPGKLREPARRDDVARERLLCHRIDDRRRHAREVAGQERGIGHAGEQRPGLFRPQPLVRPEREHLVLDQGTAEREPGQLPVARLLPEVVLGLEARVAEIIVAGTGEPIRAGLGHDRHDGLSLSVLRCECVSQHVDFLHRVERRVQRQVVEAQRSHVHAVDRVIGGAVASTFDCHVQAAAAARGAELRAARK